METLTELVDLYVLRCEVEGKSPRTIQAYRYTLGRFVGALNEDQAPDRAADITREHVYAYLGRFTDHAADTRHRYFREVRCFFNWLVDADYLDQTPFRGMKNIRLPQHIVRPFPADEFGALLARAGMARSGSATRLLMTLLDTGARCSEVVPQPHPVRLRLPRGRSLGERDGPTRPAVPLRVVDGEAAL